MSIGLSDVLVAASKRWGQPQTGKVPILKYLGTAALALWNN
jgi:hypothetical protein